MKKLITFLMALVMLMGCLTGCGGSGTDATKENEEETQATKEIMPVTDKPVIDEPVTLNILTQRHAGATTDASDLWFFKYMEYWFAQQGYDVTINVQQTAEPTQQTALLLGTNSLPDIIWGIPLGNTDIVSYGQTDGIIMDWSPYINESIMPNLTKQFNDLPDVKEVSTAPDGGIYALPYFTPSQLASGCYGTSERLYYRQSWLDACGVKNPTTLDEFYETLRAFKNMKTPNGQPGIPLVSAEHFLEKYLWTCLGFYGTEPNAYGSNLMIKDGQVVVPAYTESYKDFIEVMNTLYSEGLVPEDYFSMSEVTAGGLMRDNMCGALCWWTLEYIGDDFDDIVCSNPISIGGNTEYHVSRLTYYTKSLLWGSANTQYPELVAMLMDFVYSDEGAFIYRYGPKEGEDPLDLVDGWFYDEDGNITTKMVEDGIYSSMSSYGRDRLFPCDNAGLRPAPVTSGTGEMKEFTDSVTGEKYYCIDNLKLDDNTNDGHWRLSTIEKWSDYATSVRLPGAFFSLEDGEMLSDTVSVIQNYVTKESAKFITGQRPLSEIPDFQAELEGLGIIEYIEMNREAYSDYMTSVFGN